MPNKFAILYNVSPRCTTYLPGQVVLGTQATTRVGAAEGVLEGRLSFSLPGSTDWISSDVPVLVVVGVIVRVTVIVGVKVSVAPRGDKNGSVGRPAATTGVFVGINANVMPVSAKDTITPPMTRDRLIPASNKLNANRFKSIKSPNLWRDCCFPLPAKGHKTWSLSP
jgi:hypothetical protein